MQKQMQNCGFLKIINIDCPNNGVTTEKCIKLMIGNILSLPDGKCCQNNGVMTEKCIKLMIGNILSLPDGKCWWITFYYKYFLFKCCNPCILRNCQFKYINRIRFQVHGTYLKVWIS